MEYLIILTVLLSITLFLEWRYKIHLYDTLGERLLTPQVFLLFGVAWDSWAVHRGTWTFSGKGLIGWTIAYLPIEEYLFMLILPYFVLTAYMVIKGLRNK
jgi:lycopene cyclase domain-containing protein